jgi:ABC-type sugar transport system substrate-binding protein
MLRKHHILSVFGLLLIQSLISSSSYAESPHIGLLCPNDLDKFFWSKVINSAASAANDLDVKLTIKCGRDLSTYEFRKLGYELLRSNPKLDYFITGYWKGVTRKHMELADELGIKVFIINADIFVEDYAVVGKLPRQRYKNWIGHMVPDDTQAGMDLAKILFERAEEADAYAVDKKMHVVSISGTEDNTVSLSRNSGLKEQMRLTLRTELTGIEFANWDPDAAYRSTLRFLQDDPGISVIFVVADRMAVGVIKAAEEANRKPGVDLFIGGFDWGLVEELKTGRMTASMGGHFLEAAWAVILIQDYHAGYDFAEDTGIRISTPLYAVTNKNIQQTGDIAGDIDWEKIDFRKYSKKHNPKLERYNFDFKQFIE